MGYPVYGNVEHLRVIYPRRLSCRTIHPDQGVASAIGYRQCLHSLSHLCLGCSKIPDVPRCRIRFSDRRALHYHDCLPHSIQEWIWLRTTRSAGPRSLWSGALLHHQISWRSHMLSMNPPSPMLAESRCDWYEPPLKGIPRGSNVLFYRTTTLQGENPQQVVTSVIRSTATQNFAVWWSMNSFWRPGVSVINTASILCSMKVRVRTFKIS